MTRTAAYRQQLSPGSLCSRQCPYSCRRRPRPSARVLQATRFTSHGLSTTAEQATHHIDTLRRNVPPDHQPLRRSASDKLSPRERPVRRSFHAGVKRRVKYAVPITRADLAPATRQPPDGRRASAPSGRGRNYDRDCSIMDEKFVLNLK